ncbi:uncharacterized protein BXZ73DRAFT_76295 [Epithele typhae]|uniref:uncharacterized protein n=1 Tax=Epithele typhae TaxID=378194 RepID=UPI0020078336|nr:uncharacterized protein BXZ73DRAFT_76295 [Epithele typhae]KAH9938787.1 hypothetical protein BXZ73DRAFT_76295 [Epithele typhae]
MSECIVWNSQTGTPYASHWYRLGDQEYYETSPSPFAFCPTERHWAIASRHDITVFPLPVETASTRPTDQFQPVGRIVLPLDCLVMRLLWSQDGTRIFAQDSAANVHIYDALVLTHLRTLAPPPISTATSGDVPGRWFHGRHTGTFALSADERYLLSDVALPFSPNSICVWTLADGSCEPHLLRYQDGSTPDIANADIYATALRQHSGSSPEPERRPHVVVICKNGTLLTATVGAPDGAATIRPAGLPADLQSLEAASFSSDGTRVLVFHAMGPSVSLVLDTLTGATIASLDGRRGLSPHTGTFARAKLSSNGHVVAIRDSVGSEWWLWRLEDGTLCKVPGHEGRPNVRKWTLSPDASVVGFATEAGEVLFSGVWGTLETLFWTGIFGSTSTQIMGTVPTWYVRACEATQAVGLSRKAVALRRRGGTGS